MACFSEALIRLERNKWNLTRGIESVSEMEAERLLFSTKDRLVATTHQNVGESLESKNKTVFHILTVL